MVGYLWQTVAWGGEKLRAALVEMDGVVHHISFITARFPHEQHTKSPTA